MTQRRKWRPQRRTPALPHTAASLGRYLAAIDASAIVSETDAEGVIIRVNDAFCDVAGYSRSELVGSTHRLVKSGEHDQAFFSELWRTVNSGEIWRGQICNRRKDGALYWLETTITPFMDEEGNPERFVAIRHDVTATVTSLELLSTSERRFRALFDNAGVGIALIDPDGIILEASAAFCRFVGLPLEAVQGMPFTDFAADDFARDAALLQEIIEGRRERYEITKRYRAADGTARWGQTTVSVARGFGDDFPAMVGVVRDVTAVHDAEVKLRRQAALAHLGEMAAVVAHEVRNPLAGILGATKMIGRGLPADAPEQAVIATITDRIGALEALVEELLIFSRPQEPQLRSTDLRDVVESACAQLAAEEDRDQSEVEVAGDSVRCWADPVLLERALLNLVLNAVHVAREQPVRVEVRTDEGFGEVTVLDDGPGIAPGLKQSMFEPFITTKSRGVGLGLPTAARIVQAHGGTLTVDDRPGGGARAQIRIPLEPSGTDG